MKLTRFEMLRKSAHAATYNMVLQLFLKMISFVLNMIVIRLASKDMLGVVNIRLYLLYTTVLFLGTEAFDNASLSKIEGTTWRQVINLMWLTVPLTWLLSCICIVVWLYVWKCPDPEIIPNYYVGVISYAMAAVIATLARPHFTVAVSNFFTGLRVGAVAVGESFKVLIAVILLWSRPEWGITCFAVGLIIGEILYVITYYTFFWIYVNTGDEVDKKFAFQSTRDFFPKWSETKPFLNERMAMLTQSVFRQSLLKIFLTEGEKYVMTIFGVLSLADQGVYGIVNNLGSMIPRFVFQPVEESGRVFFSQLLLRGKKFVEQPKDEAVLAYQVLKHLLRVMLVIGCIILVFGNNYAFLLLDLYGGEHISEGSGPYILKWFCVYVLILAINGIMECFHFALMNIAETDSYNKKMLLFSIVSLVSTLLIPQYFGGAGFIIANILTMMTRIFYSLLFIREFYHGTEYRPLKSLIPSIPFCISLIISSLIMKLSESFFCCDQGLIFRLVHVGIGGLSLLGVIGVIYFTETDVSDFVIKHYRKTKAEKREAEERKKAEEAKKREEERKKSEEDKKRE
ncbi:protein RFT1 homolog [Mytilus trossulus]|uniref:protein RFT1 homolog n=1 Tax=Mytilus trossulus TaxID=6551 RepID=UPI0030066A43